MTHLDKNALEAAYSESGAHPWASSGEQCEKFLNAYLSALPPSPVSDLVGRLRSWDHCWPAPWLENAVSEAAYTLTTLSFRNAELERGIDRLAAYIMENVPGEPSENQGAVDTAIRLLGKNAELEREVKRLREVMQPFFEAAEYLDDSEQDKHDIWEHPVSTGITIGDLRAVRRALSTSPRGGEHE